MPASDGLAPAPCSSGILVSRRHKALVAEETVRHSPSPISLPASNSYVARGVDPPEPYQAKRIARHFRAPGDDLSGAGRQERRVLHHFQSARNTTHCRPGCGWRARSGPSLARDRWPRWGLRCPPHNWEVTRIGVLPALSSTGSTTPHAASTWSARWNSVAHPRQAIIDQGFVAHRRRLLEIVLTVETHRDAFQHHGRAGPLGIEAQADCPRAG